MIFVFIAIILIFLVIYNNYFEPSKFLKDVKPAFRLLIESDYEFLLKLKYGEDVDVQKMYSNRVKNALLVSLLMFVLFISQMQFIMIILVIIIGYFVFKQSYISLRGYYKANLHNINLLLPYYLKSLEILVQHYTVPVALSRSIDQAPEVFKMGLRTLVAQIEAGDMTVDPYMEFARTYPVRDSMRMMRLLYRLSLGSQDEKQEQLMMFSRTVSNLQNKSREQRYAERLGKMEQKTMVMLFATGGGILVLLLLSMMQMMNF